MEKNVGFSFHLPILQKKNPSEVVMQQNVKNSRREYFCKTVYVARKAIVRTNIKSQTVSLVF